MTVTLDGRLIVWGQRGKLVLVEGAERSTDRYRELASHDKLAADLAWPHVVVAEGRLFGKDRAGGLSCWKLEK